ncbi:MAG TPA: L-histidine N(alpha)-methyltransferase, partial [Skermanella sp.]|nr:L-histidine N(alpha)-methyltransferase [Skermanella sp.]
MLRNATAPRPVTVAQSVVRLDAGFLEDVLDGLGQTEKTLPAKYFYDERGSKLFDEICE